MLSAVDIQMLRRYPAVLMLQGLSLDVSTAGSIARSLQSLREGCTDKAVMEVVTLLATKPMKVKVSPLQTLTSLTYNKVCVLQARRLACCHVNNECVITFLIAGFTSLPSKRILHIVNEGMRCTCDC